MAVSSVPVGNMLHARTSQRTSGKTRPALAPQLLCSTGPMLAHSGLRTARSRLRSRNSSGAVSCNSESGKADQLAKGKEEGGAAIELAEEGPSTDLSVIWGRLTKARRPLLTHKSCLLHISSLLLRPSRRHAM